MRERGIGTGDKAAKRYGRNQEAKGPKAEEQHEIGYGKGVLVNISQLTSRRTCSRS